jgi:hypothetical protein
MILVPLIAGAASAILFLIFWALRPRPKPGVWYVNGKRIPDDARARAEKAGATKPPDWYAGR